MKSFAGTKRASYLQLSASQRRLEDVSSINCTLSSTSTNKGVNLRPTGAEAEPLTSSMTTRQERSKWQPFLFDSIIYYPSHG